MIAGIVRTRSIHIAHRGAREMLGVSVTKGVSASFLHQKEGVLEGATG